MLRFTTLASALLLAAFAQDKPVPKDKPAEDSEESVAAKKGSLTPVFELEAVYEAVDSAEFKLKLEAYQGELTVAKVVAAGELVKKGDLLLSFDRATIEKQTAALENDLRVARATHEKQQADLTIGARADALALAQAENQVRDAQASLKSFEEVDGKHMVQTAELNAKYLEDAIHDQGEELAQLEKMYKSEELTNATSEIVVRRARRNLERTKTALEMAKLEASNVLSVKYPQQRNALAHQVEVAKNALESLNAARTLSRIQREAEAQKAKTALAQLEEQAAKLKKDLESFAWTAPLDGRVFYGAFQHGAWTSGDQLAAMLLPGEKIQAGQVLLTVCGPRTRARADLAEADYFDVAPGLAVTVTPAAAPETRSEGTVQSKSSVPSMKGQGASFELHIEFKEPPSDLLPGMRGKATVKGKELKDIVVVPSNAVSGQAGKAMLNVVKDGKATPREVLLGRSDGKMIQIRTGLEAGEKVTISK